MLCLRRWLKVIWLCRMMAWLMCKLRLIRLIRFRFFWLSENHELHGREINFKARRPAAPCSAERLGVRSAPPRAGKRPPDACILESHPVNRPEQPTDYCSHRALLHKSEGRRDYPSPRRSYAMAPTGTVLGRPSCVKRLSRATRTCNSTTCRSNVRAITRWPRRLKQCILVSTRLLR